MKLQIDSMRFTPGEGLVVEGQVGDTYGELRLTDSGITDDKSGWWYFLRKYDNKEHPYWYMKKRKEATGEYPEGEVVEEYVGLTLPFSVPREWIAQLRRKALSGSDSN